MYPYYQPIPVRSAPIGPVGDSRLFPFFGVPFLAGIAGGLLGGALAFGPRPFYPPYPPPFPPPAPYPCYGGPCQQPYYY
ncbi:hypothetical protein [Bacillus cereus group sp. BfR-BA-01383]|uniref:hypothetical protein n=1 Tax=Bacillus cereus group sp. BfR-BA-01383 TaxID=2920327 RepID=UPI001F5701AA|nr:hypothetical protein [Bacillus cereus group sp. BfR-BA-01383]